MYPLSTWLGGDCQVWRSLFQDEETTLLLNNELASFDQACVDRHVLFWGDYAEPLRWPQR